MGELHLHMGAPKCMSTSIQYALSKRPNTRYLGFSPQNKPDNWYPNPICKRLFDIDLKYSSLVGFLKSKDDYLSYFDEELKILNHSDIWISSENICTRFTLEEIDPVEKLNRLISLLGGHKLSIHVTFRSYISAIFAMYKEYVSRKMTQNIEYFLEDLRMLQITGIIDHLSPLRVYQNILQSDYGTSGVDINFYFPQEQSSIFPDATVLQNKLNIDLSGFPLNSTGFNVEKLRALNFENFKDNKLYSLMEFHRYINALDEPYEYDFWADRRITKSTIESLRDVSDMSSDNDFRERIVESKLYNDFILPEHGNLFLAGKGHQITFHGIPGCLL